MPQTRALLPLSLLSLAPEPLINRSAPPSPRPSQIWVTTIVLGHLLGIAFLLYSVERVTGVFSRLAHKAGLAKAGAYGGEAEAGPLSAVAGATAIDGAFVDGDGEDAASVRAPRWVRGCACKVRGHSGEREKRERDGRAGGGAAGSHGERRARAR